MYFIIDDRPDFLVVSKQQGVGIHMEGDNLGLIAQLKSDLSLEELYPVHRLDKVTSGLLLCAKTHAAASELSQLFQDRQVEKYYLAISDKKPKKKQGAIIGDMERSRRGSWKLCPTKNSPAVTQFFSYSLNHGKRLFLLKPKTGKTHQLRVALKSLGAPISGDRLYGHHKDHVSGIDLHAFTLRFHYQGQEYCYQILPEHWQVDELEVMGNLPISQPWALPWPTIR